MRSVAASVRQQRFRLAQAKRASGHTWVQIADALRQRWPELTARAALRLAHTRHGRCWTQKDAVDAWKRAFPDDRCPEAKELSRWEIWPHPGGVRPSFDTLDKMAEVYECAISDLLADVSDYRHLDSATRPKVTAEIRPQDSDNPRRDIDVVQETGELSQGAEQGDTYRAAGVLTAMAMPPGLQPLLATPGKGSPEGVRLVHVAVASLEERDALSGGGAALQMAMTLHDLVAGWLRDPPRGLEASLQDTYCELGALIGWLAYDAGQPAIARRYVNDTLALTRITTAASAEHRAMNTMCLLLSDSGRPREALQCAHQAQGSADVLGPPAATLFHIRAARTNAKLGEVTAVHHELALAEETFAQSDDRAGAPAWVQFLDESELASVVGGSYLLLGQADEAVDAYQRAIQDADLPTARNTISRTVWLAQALLRAGDVSESCRTALQVLPHVGALSSGRVARRLQRLRRAIEPHIASVPIAADLADAYEETFPPPSGLTSAM